MKREEKAISVAVITFLHDGSGKYLVGLRSRACRDEQERWEPAGGGQVQFGETLEAALTREVFEEVGAVPFNLEYLGFREVLRQQDGVTTHWIAFDYRAQVESSQVSIKEPEKCLELRWCLPTAIPEPKHSQFPLFLDKYRSIL